MIELEAGVPSIISRSPRVEVDEFEAAVAERVSPERLLEAEMIELEAGVPSIVSRSPRVEVDEFEAAVAERASPGRLFSSRNLLEAEMIEVEAEFVSETLVRLCFLYERLLFE